MERNFDRVLRLERRCDGAWCEVVCAGIVQWPWRTCCINSEPPPLDHAATDLVEKVLLLLLVVDPHVTLCEFEFCSGKNATHPRRATRQLMMLMLVNGLLTWVHDLALKIEVMFARRTDHDPRIAIGILKASGRCSQHRHVSWSVLFVQVFCYLGN